MTESVHHQTKKGADMALAKKQISPDSHKAVHEGRISLDEALVRIVRRTKALARRQVAWFRRDPRIRWFEVGDGGALEAIDDVEEHLRG